MGLMGIIMDINKIIFDIQCFLCYYFIFNKETFDECEIKIY